MDLPSYFFRYLEFNLLTEEDIKKLILSEWPKVESISVCTAYPSRFAKIGNER